LLILQHFKEMMKKVTDIFEETPLSNGDVSGSHNGAAEDSSVLGCYAVSVDEKMFRKNYILHLWGQAGQEVLLDPEDKCTATLRNVGNYSPNNTG
jgi:hypothetical protein